VTTEPDAVTQAEYWNGEEAQHWLAYEARYEAMLGPFTRHVMSALDLAADDAVLDVGCGCGATTLAAARIVTQNTALGVDLSAPMIGQARNNARAAGLLNASFVVADAEVHSFEPAAFGAVISRFGVMFFSDAVAGFANLRRALRPGGVVAFTCWRSGADNEWLTVPGLAAAQYVPLPSLETSGAPGPFSLADRDRIVEVLTHAGFTNVSVEAQTERLLVGTDPADTAAFLTATGMGRTLLADAGPNTVERVAEAIGRALEPFHERDGVHLGAAAWLVTAQRPRPGVSSP
jgi:SAM-dependent methyltransferase